MTRQLDLYGGTAPFVKDNETSEEAAHDIARYAAGLRAKIYARIRQSGSDGMTCDEVEAVTQLRHQTASARIRELYLLGRITKTPDKRRTRSGRNAAVYVAK